MAPKNQNQQFILIGLAAVAAAGVFFFLSQQATAKSVSKDDDGKSGSKDTSVSKGQDRSLDTSTVKTSNKSSIKATKTASGKMEEKELHAQIEELDKKGKAYFKNKQVRKNTGRLNDSIGISVCSPLGSVLFICSSWRQLRHSRRR